MWDDPDSDELIPLFSDDEITKIVREMDTDAARIRDPFFWLDPVCQCGSEKTYGKNSGAHSSWCPKARKW